MTSSDLPAEGQRDASAPTDTADAPWTVIKSDCKKRARLSAMRYVLHKLPYANKDTNNIGTVDSLLVGRAHVVYERGERPGSAIL